MNDQTENFLTVIMPCYNHEAYVAEAIESVRSQTWSNWELWIVDDGSTDGSPEIIRKFAEQDERIHVITQDNAGPAAARNTGIRHSSSQWLAFIDSDDVFYPTALADFAEFITENPEAQFIYGYRHRLNSNGSITELAPEYQDRVTGAFELFGRMFISRICYRRSLWEAVGGYDERMRIVEDYDLYLRMSKSASFYPLGKATGLRRRHETNISQQTGHIRSLQAMVLERFLNRHGGKDIIPPELITSRMHKIYYSAGRQYFKERCFGQSSRALEKACGYKFSLKAAVLRGLAALLGFAGKVDDRPLPPM